MSTEKLAIGFSKNSSNQEAIKEISLQIKTVLRGKPIRLAFLFFTPHYKPGMLKEVLDITLRPQNIFGMQVPLLICEDTVLKSGVAMVCFAPDTLLIERILSKENDAQKIESALRKTLVKSGLKKRDCMFAFLSPNINIQNYLQGLSLTLGKTFKVFGGGFIRKYGIKNFQITNNIIDEGANSVILGDAPRIEHEKAYGFLPLGRSFRITKLAHDKSVISEIDNKPAASVYRRYLEDEFALFKKTSFGSFYPLGIKINRQYRIVNVLDVLEDDSLFCLGEFKEGDEGRIMMATATTLIDSAKQAASYIKFARTPRVVLVINSMTRKKILGQDAAEEIKIIKNTLGRDTHILGFYCDYQLFPQKETGSFTIDNNHMCMVLL